MKTVSWDVAPCSLLETDDVSEVLTASIITLMMEQAVSNSEMPFSFYYATLRKFPADRHLHFEIILTFPECLPKMKR
jgi:hypothetical protein